MTGETTEIPVYVKPNQKSVTIHCPKCSPYPCRGTQLKSAVERVTCKNGVSNITDVCICESCGHQFTWRTTTDRCHHCKIPMILEHDSDGWDLNHWEDLKGNVYCDNCYHDLYTEPEEKATDNLHHSDKRVRERAKAKLEKLKSIWGTS